MAQHVSAREEANRIESQRKTYSLTSRLCLRLCIRLLSRVKLSAGWHNRAVKYDFLMSMFLLCIYLIRHIRHIRRSVNENNLVLA